MISKKSFYKLLKSIPKCEIHLHAEGVISKSTARVFLSRNNDLFKDKKEVDDFFSYNSLDEFVKVFLSIQKSFKYLSDFKLLINDVVKYLKRNGIVYSEIYISPSFFIKNGWDFDSILSVMLKKIKKIKKRDKISIKLIIDISRTFGVKNAGDNLNNLIDFKKNHVAEDVIGIGLGGTEPKGPARDFKEIFLKAQDHNLHRVAHAGEDVGPESVWDAIRLLHAERIGHGISSIYDPDLIKYLVENDIPLEICPTSNTFTKKYVNRIEEHPIREFYSKGVAVTLNTDDPTFFGVDLIDEYWNLYTKLNFSLDEIKNVIINSIRYSFMDDSKKRKFIRRVDKNWRKKVKKINH